MVVEKRLLRDNNKREEDGDAIVEIDGIAILVKDAT